ncbi:MAG: right-handed parallel beta-helix repeat-containing protein, partial [Candidatus Pacearchaeota archaeon]
MVYKKYFEKGGKKSGPYYYESYRDGKHIRKIYIGGEKEYKKWLAKKHPIKIVEQPNKRINLGGVLFLLSLIILVFILGWNFGSFTKILPFSYTGFIVSEDISLAEQNTLLYGNYESEVVVEQFDNGVVDLEIKEPPKFEGDIVSKNKNKRMEFNTPEGNIRLYFDLMNYSEFVDEINELVKEDKRETESGEKIYVDLNVSGEQIGDKSQAEENAGENISEIVSNETSEIVEQDNETIIEENETSEIIGEDNETIIEEIVEEPVIEENVSEEIVEEPTTELTEESVLEETSLEESVIEETSSESTDEALITGNVISEEIFSLTAEEELRLEEIKDKVDKLDNKEIKALEEKSNIAVEDFEVDVASSEEDNYKWGYKVKLNNLNFMAKIDVTSDKEISIYNEDTLRIGNQLLSFNDLVKAGYTVRIEKPALEIVNEDVLDVLGDLSNEEVIEENETKEITGITGNVISRFNQITGRAIDIESPEIKDVEYANKITIYFEKDFTDNYEGIKVGDIINLDPTLTYIYASKAEHLDSDGNFVSDVYDNIKEQDETWSEIIGNNEFVRVTFERNLTNQKDITVYARSSGSEVSQIEVYAKNSNDLITTFDSISSEDWYKVYLTNLAEGESYDVFDLKVIGSIEFDYIVDPQETITGCTILNQSDTVYVLQNNIGATGSSGCLNVQANNITIDLNGYTMTGGGTDLGAGIYVSGYNYTTIRNGKINYYEQGIYFYSSNDNYISNVTFSHSSEGWGNYQGIVLSDSSNNIINDINITESDDNAIQLFGGSNNSFTNVTIGYDEILFGYGISFSSSSNNVFSNVNLKSTETGFWFAQSSNNNKVINSNISCIANSDVTVKTNSLNNSLVNTTYISESLEPSSQLIRKWYYTAYVNDTNGNDVVDANITAYNSTGAYQFNLTTGEDGLTTSTAEIVDYVNNGGTKTYYSPYNIFALSSGYSTLNQSWNVTAKNNTRQDFTLSLTTNLTSCGILSSANTVYTLAQNITATGTCFNITAENITLDLNYYTILGDISSVSKGVVSYKNYTVIKNGFIQNFTTGVHLYGGFANLTNISIDAHVRKSEEAVFGYYPFWDGSVSFMGVYLDSFGNLNQLDNLKINLSKDDSNNVDFMGVYILSDNNNLQNLQIITGSGSESISRAILIASDNNLIKNSVLDSVSEDVFIVGNANIYNNTLLNTSYDTETVQEQAGLIRKWYYTAYVNDTNGNDVVDANITAYNQTGAYNFNLTTGSDGLTTSSA